MVLEYWSVAILFWQLSIDHIVNVLYERCGLTKTRLRHPSLPFDSLPYPTRAICRRVRAYVRTYARSITWQPNEKRLTIFHEYGDLSHARFARAGAPLSSGLKPRILNITRKKIRKATYLNHVKVSDLAWMIGARRSLWSLFVTRNQNRSTGSIPRIQIYALSQLIVKNDLNSIFW